MLRIDTFHSVRSRTVAWRERRPPTLPSTRDSNTGPLFRGKETEWKMCLMILQEPTSFKGRQILALLLLLMKTMTTSQQVCKCAKCGTLAFNAETVGGDPRSLGGVAMQSLPGNTPKVHKPHPPSKLAPPGVRSRMAHVKRGEKPAQQNFSEQVHHNGMTNGYSSSEHDEQDHPRHINSSPLIKRVRNVRSGQLGSREGGARNGLGLESHSDRSSNESEIPQTHSLGIGDQRRGPLQR